jgi:hypothetical protein
MSTILFAIVVGFVAAWASYEDGNTLSKWLKGIFLVLFAAVMVTIFNIVL